MYICLYLRSNIHIYVYLIKLLFNHGGALYSIGFRFGTY